jgi:hypothetical protein
MLLLDALVSFPGEQTVSRRDYFGPSVRRDHEIASVAGEPGELTDIGRVVARELIVFVELAPQTAGRVQCRRLIAGSRGPAEDRELGADRRFKWGRKLLGKLLSSRKEPHYRRDTG